MSDYFVMSGFAAEPIVLLYSLKSPGGHDNWMLARKFSATVEEPVEAVVIPDNEDGILLPIYGVPQVMRKDLYEILLSVGVDNIDVYQAILRREDGTIVSNDYIAYNILGAVKAASSGTLFSPENPSRMVDASFEKIVIDTRRTMEFLLFRLAESIRTVVVHAKVKTAIEARKIPNIMFIEIDEVT